MIASVGVHCTIYTHGHGPRDDTVLTFAREREMGSFKGESFDLEGARGERFRVRSNICSFFSWLVFGFMHNGALKAAKASSA